MSDFAIRVQNLAKNYDGFRAVKGITFSVESGTTFGFLGPNGAGKTTSIKMLCTLLRPSGGDALVAGNNILHNPMGVRKSIGIVFQDPTLDDRLTAYENLKFHGILYGMGGKILQARILEMLRLVGLEDKASNRVKTFSGGMKRRLELARGLMHEPRILFLDEPTLGLDPQTRLHIWDYLRTLKATGSLTIFLTTHYMEEAENCDRIAIIDQGEIAAVGSPASLKSQVRGTIVQMKTSDDPKAASFFKSKHNLETKTNDEGVHVEIDNPEQWLPGVLREIPVSVQQLFLHRPTLEDVFIKLTGREMREEEGSWLDGARARMMGRRR